MSIGIDINYKNNQLEYPELTRIIGEPTTATLIVLLNEVRANASSVHMDLGGGQDGHLGLVCSPEVYQELVPNGEPYIRPNNPGRLHLDLGMTRYEIAHASDEHNEETRVFREVIGVERAIRQKFVTAIEPTYLRALRTPGTNKLTQTIPEIFDHLFSTYGDVTPQDLRELTARVEGLSYPPQEPVDTIFSEIDDLATIANYAKASLTSFQKINMAYIYFQKCGIFKSALTKWDESPDDAKTWLSFKEHFRAAHKAMKRTGALTIQDTLNRDAVAHMVQEELQQVLVTPQDSQDIIDLAESDHQSASPATLPPTTATTTSSATPSIASDITMQTMQQQMAMIQQLAMANQPLCLPVNSDNPSTQQKEKRKWNQMKFCWTHGACNHWSPECRTKAEGHQNSATFQNCKGGSTKNLQ